MKKLLIVLFVIVLIASIGFNVVASYNRFTWNSVWRKGLKDLYIVKDKVTGVCYLVYDGAYKAGITVMYDSKGNILIEK